MIEAQEITIQSLKLEQDELKAKHQESEGRISRLEVEVEVLSDLKARIAKLEAGTGSNEGSASTTPVTSAPSTPASKRKERRGTLLRAIGASATVQFGGTLETIMSSQAAKFPNEELPKAWTTLVRLLHETHGLEEEGKTMMFPQNRQAPFHSQVMCFSLDSGIFRKSGALGEINKLKDMLNTGHFNLTKDQFEKKFNGDVHVLACALKQWVTELEEPIIPACMYANVCTLRRHASYSSPFCLI